MNKTQPYFPLTATPFKQNKEYKELAPSTPELSKYIRCFWGSEKPYTKTAKAAAGSIVIPDTCVDIIYQMDYTENTIVSRFCGMNDTSFLAQDESVLGHLISTFAIRFYGWEAYVFSEDSMRDTLNGFYDVPSRFRWLDIELKAQLWEADTLLKRVKLVEDLFCKYIDRHMFQLRENNVFESAIANMLSHKGTLSIARLAKDSFVSSRHLERIFNEYIGVTPKKLSNLVRYQLLWDDVLRDGDMNISDMAYKYGYADQAHLMREFRRYHAMDIRKARVYALENVENIQDIGRLC
ncbi:MAG: AraC family transcriptional regulator [Lachnospiraceae bacterium]|nr:AraC family transcriptional regulator [Lachnospiraceae bacterium]